MNPRDLLWIVPLLLFVSSPLWKGRAEDFLRPRGGYDPALAQKMHKSRNIVLDKVTITLTSSGHREWVVKASSARTGKSDRDILMYEVDALHVAKDGLHTHITSRSGAYNADKRHLILQDQVVIRRPAKDQELFTDLLHYYDTTKMAISPVPVELHSPDVRITANRMDYDVATGAYDFSGNVHCEL